jgi:exopolysaccharide production protein ExoZ
MLRNIQVLRGIAATLVVWVHTQDIIPLGFIPGKIREAGYGGVDLFFVISGFIMVFATSNRAVTPQSFLLKRFLRVAPLYYVVTLFVVLLCIVRPTLFKSTTIDIETLYKSFLFIPFEKSHDRIYPIYPLGWTLNYEMFFYCLFSIAMFLESPKRVIALAIVLTALSGIGLFIFGIGDYGIIAYFYTRPVILDFVLGMIIAICLLRPDKMPVSFLKIYYPVLLLGCISFLFSGFLVHASQSPVTPTTDTLLRFGLPSALIVASLVGLERLDHTIDNEFFRQVGDASYSIYLTHYFVVESLSPLVVRTVTGPTFLFLAALATIAASVLFGILVYRLVERPLTGDFRYYSFLGRNLDLAKK